MLHAITLELKAALTARGCPVPVFYGPERPADAATNKPRIVLQYDRDKGDNYSTASSQRSNPKLAFVRAKGCLCRIFAQSNVAGAAVQNHEREADQIADHVQVCLDTIVRNRHTRWSITGGKFMSADDLAMRGETWTGVVYEFTFSIDRGVSDVTWRTPTQSAGSAQEEHTMVSGELAHTTQVRRDGGSWEPVT